MDCIVAFSEQCIAKFVHGVLLLYLRTLAIDCCESEKKAAKLYFAVSVLIVSHNIYGL